MRHKTFLFLGILFLFPAMLMATHLAVLETVANSPDLMTLSERQYLTNILREQAVKVLPAEQNYIIMTRENINMMLPPGKAIEDCEGSCMAETGRNIAAEYVAQAHVGQFGSSLTINVELYETASGKLLTSFNGRGDNVEKLEQVINEKSEALFERIKANEQKSEIKPIVEFVTDTVNETVDTVAENIAKDSVGVQNELNKDLNRYESAENTLENDLQKTLPLDTVETETAMVPESRKRLWLGLLIGMTYNDFYDSKLGLANLKSTEEYSLKVKGDDELLGNYWGIGFNAGVSGLFLFNDYLALRGDVSFAYRNGSGKSDVTVKLYWVDESKQQEKADLEIEYTVSQKNIDIPLAFRVMVPGLAYAELGPMMSFNLYSKTESAISGNGGSGEKEIHDDFNLLEFDALVGVGVMRYIGKSILDLNLRLVIGVTPLTDASDAPKTWQGQFNVSYWFI